MSVSNYDYVELLLSIPEPDSKIIRDYELNIKILQGAVLKPSDIQQAFLNTYFFPINTQMALQAKVLKRTPM